MGVYRKDFAKFYDTQDFARFDLRAFKVITALLTSRRLNPKRCLDLACGNGVASVLFAKKGMKVIGMDISEDMLKLARRRAKNAGVTVDFILRDMRNFTLIEKVDLVVSLYDSLNYLLTPSDLEDCFECVFDSLRDNGLFIFDMNTRRTLRNWNSWRYFNESSNTGLVGSFNSKTNLAKLKAVLFVKRKNGNYKRLTEVHEERAYANREIKDALRNAGFPEIELSVFPKSNGRLLGMALK